MKTTPQLESWTGDFGDDYIKRNQPTEQVIGSRLRMWSEILRSVGTDPGSILEVGCNLGLNLRALKLLTVSKLYGIEPNKSAIQQLIDDGIVSADFVAEATAAKIPHADQSVDLVFTSGVLIHIPPSDLPAAYREMHRVSKRFILSVEYFSDQPAEIPYRGKEGHLFKRDFGAMWKEMFPDLETRGTGFFWKHSTGLDNLTWWLFEKPNYL